MVEIGFFGIPSEDMAVYIARLFMLSGKEVAIYDEECSYSGCPFPVLCDREEVKRNEDRFDILITLAGENVSLLEKCAKAVIVTDRQPNNARKTAEALLFRQSEEDLLIIRDTILQEYDDSYILRLLGMEKVLASIAFSENDLRIRCRIQDGKRYELKSLSKVLLAGMLTLYKALSGTDDREAYRLLRKERKRKWENCLHFSRHGQA